jgi:PAS domain S-box-containing protein
VRWANAAYADLAPEEPIGRLAEELPLDELLHRAPSAEPWRQASVRGRKTGETYVVALEVTTLRDSAGEVTGFWIAQRENSRTKSEADAPNRFGGSFSALFESTQDFIWLVDLDFRLAAFNRAFADNIERNFGVQPTIGMRPEELLTPARAALWSPFYRRALTEGPFRVEYPLIDGRMLELTFNPVLDNGETTGVSVYGKDITEGKKAARILEEAEHKYRSIFEGAMEGIFRTTLDGKGLAANPALAAMLGYRSTDEFLSMVTDAGGQVWSSPEERDWCLQLLERDGALRAHECLAKRKDGSTLWVAVSIQKISGTGDQPDYYEGFIEDISTRKRMEESLRQSEEKFAKAFLCSPSIMILTDLTEGGRIVDVNETFERLTGHSREAAIGHTARELGLWVDLREYDESMKQFRDTGHLNDTARRFRTKGGELGVGLVSGERIELGGKPHAIWTVLDITERKRAEARLQAERDRFQSILENADVGYFRIGLNGRYEEVNPAWLRMYGFARREEAIGLHFSAVQAPECLAQAAEVNETLLRGAPAIRGEFSRRRRDGTAGYHNFSASAIFDGNRVTGIEGFLLDTSDRKTAEQERQRAEQVYRSLFDSMQEGVAIHKLVRSNGRTENYVLLEVNPRFEEILGVRREDAVDKLATDVYKSSEPPYLAEYAAVVETGTSVQFETYYPPMDKHFLISVAPMGEDGFATIFFDITGQKKSEEGMRSLVTAIEQTSETVVITDLDGTVRYCNPACEKVTGYSKQEMIGQNPRILKSGTHDAGFYRRMWATITQGNVWVGRLTNRKKDGTLFEEDATISPIRGAGDRISGFVAVKRDVTEQLQLERQFRQAQKLESVGRLAGGVAHDFNNLLTVINGYGDLLLKSLRDSDPSRMYAEEIRTAGGRAASLTKQLLAFGRKQLVEPAVVDLNATIRQSAPMLQRLIGEDIALETHLDDSVGCVMADPDQIHQVIMNLVVNARDAMPKGGKLEIAMSGVELAPGESAAIFPNAIPGRYILITVTDTGHGIEEAIRQHIFEPFFTTKEEGKGTGLGLSTVYGIVRQNGGWIDVRSEVGAGSSFLIYLPRVDASPVAEPSPNAASAEAGSETILVVEDQEAVRVLIKSVLQERGYRVVAACDGDEAMAVAERHTGRIHLLLTDVILPGMNGKELSEVLLKKMGSDLKVLFISGYTANVIVRSGTDVRSAPFLHKPFSPDELAAKVREVLTVPGERNRDR